MENIAPDFSTKVLQLIWANDRALINDQITDWTPAMWGAARFTTQSHGIAPLLYKVFLNHQVIEDLEADFRSYITEQYKLNSLRIDKIQEILKTLLTKASSHNIPIMPLKGAILINGFYQDPAIRPMADIDLLIYPEDHEKVCHILESMALIPATSYKEKIYTNTIKPVSIEGEHPDNPIKIELHHEINWPIGHLNYPITDVIWENAQNGFIGFPYAYAPALERLLLMLICHNGRNQFNGKMRFFQLYDIAKVAGLMNNDQWAELNSIVKKYQLERLMFSGLAIAKRFTEVVLPEDLFEEYAQHTPPKLQHQTNSQNLDSLNATYENKLLTLQVVDKSSKFNKNLLNVYQLLIIAIVQSFQLRWFFSGKEKIKQMVHSMSPSAYMKDQWGHLMAFIIHWIIIPVALVPILFLGTRLREKILWRLKLTLLSHRYGIIEAN